jgi:hypothetical protein
MAGMIGLALADEVLRLRPGLPIVLGTGFSEDVDAWLVAERWHHGFLMEPHTVRTVGEALRRAFAGNGG